MIPRVGSPWAYPCEPPASWDCWTAVAAVRATLGLTGELSIDSTAYAPETLSRAVCAEMAAGSWRELPAPEPGAVVVFPSYHVGVFVDRSRVLHVALGVGVQIATWRAIRRSFPDSRILQA